MASQPDMLEACFKQGTEARERGMKPNDNPYDIETEEHKEWAAGWHATLDLDEDDDPVSMRIDAGEDARDDAPSEPPIDPGDRRPR